MVLGILITIAGGGSVLLAYALIERRINQRACPHCGFRVAVETLDEQCPKCDGWCAPKPTRVSGRFDNARLAQITLIGLPLLVMTTDAAVLVHHGGRPATDKAISLVQTSSSRIENFTVQQYLYATLFESKRRGVQVTIEGWRAWQDHGDEHSAKVEFDFKREGKPHAALWDVDISTDKVTARTEDARNLSWPSS
jgi:hypothetical protein